MVTSCSTLQRGEKPENTTTLIKTTLNLIQHECVKGQVKIWFVIYL